MIRTDDSSEESAVSTDDSSEESAVRIDDSLRAARRLAETLIYEGYLLYPYRASAQKNQVRWQWGVLAPPAPAPRLAETSLSRAECLLEPRAGAALTVEVRFLQLQARSVEAAGADGFTPVESLMVDGVEHTAWDEGAEITREFRVEVGDLLADGPVVDIVEQGGSEEQLLHSVDGHLQGRFMRRRWPLHGRVTVQAERLPGPYGALRLQVVTENVSDWDEADAQRPEVMRRSLLGAHTMLACTEGRFLSLLDPPEWAKPATAACVNERVWPVLVGEPGREVMLCSPIIVYDHPEIAAESPGDLYDALEIDEILSLRTMTLTEEEKRQARATDPRAAAIIDRVDSMPAELVDKLHGAVRYLRGGPQAPDPSTALPWDVSAKPDAPWWDPGMDASVSPETDTIVIDGVQIGRGCKVRLMPGRHRRTDAQDAFLVGRLATVQAVLFDVDDATHLAVTVDDDPGAEMQQAHGRFLYFQPDEVEAAEAISAAEAAAGAAEAILAAEAAAGAAKADPEVTA
ncbi:MAG: hypothetical protein M3500_12445 [Actinomycetota bacterium]|nr:hypothetical protein [Actinomycetota bacterium]